MLLKKDFEGGLRATLIQDQGQTRNLDSKIYLPGFYRFKFEFHSFFSETFSTASVKTGSALVEHKISASPPKPDICALLLNDSLLGPPTFLLVLLPGELGKSDPAPKVTRESRLLPRNAGGIVGCMPLSRTQPMPDLFGAVADHEPHYGPPRLTSIRPTPAVMGTADKSSPRYVLPKDLSNALQQLDDLELDRLVAASRHELRRRGRPMTSAPEIRPTTHISPGELTSKPLIAKDSRSERQQLPEPKGT